MAVAASRLDAINAAIACPLVVGSTYFAVSCAWLARFASSQAPPEAAAAAAAAPEGPGPVDSSDLADATHALCLRRGVQDGDELQLVPAAAYEQLVSWYGRAGPDFPRTAIQRGGDVVVELQPQLCLVSSTAAAPGGAPVPLLISRKASPGGVLDAVLGAGEAAVAALGLTDVSRGCARLWFAGDDGEQRAAQQPGSAAAVSAGGALAASLPASPPASGATDAWAEVVRAAPLSPDDPAGSGAGGSPPPPPSSLGEPQWAPLVAPAVRDVDCAAGNALATRVLVEVRHADGTWPRGELPFASGSAHEVRGEDPASQLAWRRSLREGVLLDVCAPGGCWLEARVASVQVPAAVRSAAAARPTPADVEARCMGELLRVRFLGAAVGSAESDQPRRSDALAPLHSRSPHWRFGLRVGDRVEASLDALAAQGVGGGGGGGRARRPAAPAPVCTGAWTLAVVGALDHTQHPPLVTLVYPLGAWDVIAGPGSALPAGFQRAEGVFTAVVPLLGTTDDLARVGTRISGSVAVPAAYRQARAGPAAASWLALRYPRSQALEAAGLRMPALPEQAAYTEADNATVLELHAAAAAAVATELDDDEPAAPPPPFSAHSLPLGTASSSAAAQPTLLAKLLCPTTPARPFSSSSAPHMTKQPAPPASSRRYETRGKASYDAQGGDDEDDDDVGGGGGGGAGPASRSARGGGPTDVDKEKMRSDTHLAYYSRFSGGYSYNYGSNSVRNSRAAPGVVGLSNMGNTCFMNSLLQCLSNTRLLTEFFTSTAYCADINVRNPLGRKGSIAHAYGGLMRAMWSGEFSSLSPRPVKDIVSKFAPQFEGWGQHDSQEFLTFLLDGLLEDTCRVHPKPHVPAIEAAPGQSDADVARCAWDAFQSRSASAIVDVFGGQYRSRVECNQCSHTSITFDPFLSLSVPISTTTSIKVNILYVDSAGSAPVEYFLDIVRSSSQPAVTVSFLARQLLARIRADEAWARAENSKRYGIGRAPADVPLPGALASFGAFSVPLPVDPAELLFLYTNALPCVVLQALPHWEAYAAHPRLNKGVNLFVYHLVGMNAAPAGGSSADDQAPSAKRQRVPPAHVLLSSSSSSSSSSLSCSSRGAAPALPSAALPSADDDALSAGSLAAQPPAWDLSKLADREALLEAAKWRWFYNRSRPPPSMSAAGGGEPSANGGSVSEEDSENDDDEDELLAATTTSLAAATVPGHNDDDDDSDLMEVIRAAAASSGSSLTFASAAAANPPSPGLPPLVSRKRKQAQQATGDVSAVGRSNRSSSVVHMGPTASDFITVWVRCGQRPAFVDAADSVVVPLRHPVTGARITNREFHALVALKTRRLVKAPARLRLEADLADAPWEIRFVPMGAVLPCQAIEPQPCGPTEDDAMSAIVRSDYADVARLPLDDEPFTPTRFTRTLGAATLAALTERLKKSHTGEALQAALQSAGAVEVLQPVLHVPSGEWVDSGEAKLSTKSPTNAAQSGNSGTKQAGGRRSDSSAYSLDACFRLFSRREQLGDDNRWRCPRCKEEVRAFKKLDIWRLPPVLVVHLKRFQYERTGSFSGYGFGGSARAKLSTHVDFPVAALNMSAHVRGPVEPRVAPQQPPSSSSSASSSSTSSSSPPLPPPLPPPPSISAMGADGELALYDLVAVSQHYGGMGGGHYTAVARNFVSLDWLKFDDSSVQRTHAGDAVSSAAYVLFYEKRDVDHAMFGRAHAPAAAAAATAAATAAAEEEEDEPGGGGSGGGSGAGGGAGFDDDDEATDDEASMRKAGGARPSASAASGARVQLLGAPSAAVPIRMPGTLGSRSSALGAAHAVGSGGGSSTKSPAAEVAARLAAGTKYGGPK